MKKLLLLLFLFISAGLKAQKYNFTTFNIADGLPNNQVNCLLQGERGRLWIGTMNGACVYDGNDFKKFEQSNPLFNNPIKHIFQDSKGNIWFGIIRKGVCRYTGTSFKFYTSNDGLLSDIVNAIGEDRNGNIWIGTSEGLNKFNGTSFESYTTSKGLVSNTVFSIHCDRNGNLWIATIGGLSRFDGNAFTNFTTDNGLAHNIVYNVAETSDGKIWIGTYQGVSVFDGRTFISYTSADGIINDRIQDIVEDNNHDLWFATYGGGVVKYDPDASENKFRMLTYAQGLANNTVLCALEDREGNYWFGTANGLSRYTGDRFITFTTEDGLSNDNLLTVYSDTTDGSTWFGSLNGGINRLSNESFSIFNTDNGLKSNTIWCIYKDSGANMWFGTTSGAVKYNPADTTFTSVYPALGNLVIYAILQDLSGKMYFGTDRGVHVYGESSFEIIGVGKGLDNDKVRVLFQDSDGMIWIGTMKGVYYIKGDEAVCFNDQFEIAKAPVTSIIETPGKNIVISAYDFGVMVYGKSNSENPVRILNRETGLNNNRVLFNYLDRKGNMWFGTPEGLDVLNWKNFLRSGKVDLIHYDKSNGYLGVESNAASADRDGNIWFATVNGAVRFNPGAGIAKSYVPSVFIIDITLFLKKADWAKLGAAVNERTGLPEDLVLTHANNHLNFFYTGIYLTAPNEVRYRFKLDGFDDYWTPITDQTVANYANVSPGSYTFKVQATANGKQWSDPVTFSFIIKPPFWKTNLFYLLYAVTAVGLVFALLRIRTRNLSKSQTLLKKKVEARTRELQEKNVELEKLSLVASETDNAVLIFGPDLKLEWVNQGFTRMTGFSLNEFITSRGEKLSDLTNNPKIHDVLEDCIRTKKSHVYESVMRKKDGSVLWASSTLTPIFNEKGALKNVVVIDTNITARKRMEEQIKGSLEEKGVLLREIHHRVKNNLQIIISLFNLQSNFVHDREALRALKEGQGRVKSMALIHEKFYQSDGLAKIDFDEYIKRLLENIFISYGIDEQKIKLVIDAEKIALDIDTAVPCGLIINELVTNSVKHAFKNQSEGEIRIRFRQGEEEMYHLEVGDNGPGLPDNFEFSSNGTLGMQLVAALTEQLDGNISISKGGGVNFIIEFGKVVHA